MTEAHESEHGYAFDAEDASEVACLVERDEFLKNVMGGPFPERSNMDDIVHVLDIGCGPGGWAINVAHTYPSTKVIGIDSSQTMLTRARNEAQTHGLTNATFSNMHAYRTLEFPDQHFDLVNMRAGLKYVPRANWQALLSECYRITRPGGTLRLMELDKMAHTNSGAFEKYHMFYSQMLYLQGYGFSPDGQTFGITPMLGKLLFDAGYRKTDMKPYVLDLSHDTPFQMDRQSFIGIRLAKVHLQLLKKNPADPEELETTYQALLEQIAQKDFCGVAYPLIFWGIK